jgi:hypothetical protein
VQCRRLAIRTADASRSDGYRACSFRLLAIAAELEANAAEAKTLMGKDYKDAIRVLLITELF